jgi:hypothetical protein
MDNTAPTDSVLRRHYEASRPNPIDDQNKLSQHSNTGGGLMNWLKRIFGG